VGFDNIPQTAEEFNFSPNKTFKLIVYSLLAAALTIIIIELNHPSSLLAKGCKLLNEKLFPKYEPINISTAGWDVYITEIVIATVLLLVFMFIAIRGASVSGTLQYYFCVAMVIVVVLNIIKSHISPWCNSYNHNNGIKPSKLFTC
jgi:amino acid transporter